MVGRFTRTRSNLPEGHVNDSLINRMKDDFNQEWQTVTSKESQTQRKKRIQEEKRRAADEEYKKKGKKNRGKKKSKSDNDDGEKKRAPFNTPMPKDKSVKDDKGDQGKGQAKQR